jgi:hypothetical protein
MELKEILRSLRQMRGVVVLVLAAGVLAGVIAGYHVRLSSPHLEPRALPLGVADKQLLVDSPDTAITDLRTDAAPMVARTGMVAQLLTSPRIVADAARRSRIPASALTSDGPYTGAAAVLNVVTPAEARAGQILDERAPYRMSVVPQRTLPIVTIRVQGPSPEAAARVTENVFKSLEAYLGSLDRLATVTPTHRIIVRSMGPAAAGTVHAGIGKAVIVLAFLPVVIVGLLLVISVVELHRRARGLKRPVVLEGP